MATLPSLFISHGSPATILNPGKVGDALARLAADLPTPRAILVASAHFPAQEPIVSSASQPETIHDFGGFPDALYQMRYPAPGKPALAKEVRKLLEKAGFTAHEDASRGFDHGVWEPLKMLYPNADIPVVSLSIEPYKSPEYHFQIGRALATLREQGVLIIGSGSITHNLEDVFIHRKSSSDYVEPFIDWIEDRLSANDINALLDYRQQAPFAVEAHPSDEHLLPIHVAMGAAGSATLNAQRIDAGINDGVLAMDIYRFDGLKANGAAA